MADFKEKAIFIWHPEVIAGGNPIEIARLLVAAGFEAVYLHTTNGYAIPTTNGKERFGQGLVDALKNAGLIVYGWGAVYGGDVLKEARLAADQVIRYGLAGHVFDAETGWEQTNGVLRPEAPANTRTLLTEFRRLAPGAAVAWCWWPLIHATTGTAIYHPKAILEAAMPLSDVGMPMAYWSWGDDAPSAVRYLNEVWKQWREVTDKPLVTVGRACTGDGGTAKPDAVLAFDARARELGAVGISWWDMMHALDNNVVPGVWDALAQTPKFNTDEEPTMPIPIGLFTRKAGWTAINPGYNFVAGAAQVKDTVDPNPNIKPIELEAIAGNIPHLLWWDHFPWAYSEEQWGESNWPDEAHDYIYQNFKTIMGARSYQAVVVSVNTYKMRTGAKENEAPSAIAFGAKQFVERVGAWLKVNRPSIPLILACSDEFMTRYAPNMKNWAGNYPSMAFQATTLSGSYPAAGAKPAYLGNRTECEWWRYYEMSETALMVFRGANGYPADVESMAKWLNLSQPTADIIPPSVPAGLASSVSNGNVILTWSPSTDNIGVAGYQIYRDGTRVMTTTGLSVSLSGQNPGTYFYGVSAFDAAGNESAESVVSVVVSDPGTAFVTRAEFDALVASVAASEAEIAALKALAHPKGHVHPIGEPA